ncbi:MAG: hypothetical protein KJ709_01130 [Nanoarchaeota archaeon]|nr:hypothetical protein [Nanoarchaeota archaeon]
MTDKPIEDDLEGKVREMMSTPRIVGIDPEDPLVRKIFEDIERRRENYQVLTSSIDKLLFFIKETNTYRQTWVVNVDGSSLRKLSFNYIPLSWSPDGNRLLLSCNKISKNTKLPTIGEEDRSIPPKDFSGEDEIMFEVGLDGRIFFIFRDKNGLFFPTYSPDGEKIYYTSYFNGNSLMVLNRVDMTTHLIASGLGLDDKDYPSDFSLSPSGEKIVFFKQRGAKNRTNDLALINADGSGLRILDSAYHCSDPIFLDDVRVRYWREIMANKIRFWYTNSEGYVVFRIDKGVPNKTVRQRIITKSPDGKYTVKESDKYLTIKGDKEIIQFKNSYDNGSISYIWSPDSTKFVFTRESSQDYPLIYIFDIVTRQIQTIKVLPNYKRTNIEFLQWQPR